MNTYYRYISDREDINVYSYIGIILDAEVAAGKVGFVEDTTDRFSVRMHMHDWDREAVVRFCETELTDFVSRRPMRQFDRATFQIFAHPKVYSLVNTTWPLDCATLPEQFTVR